MSRTLFVALTVVLFLSQSLSAEELKDWPRDINVASGVITIYQPQVDSLDGDQLSARAAVAYRAKGAKEPVFGAVWLEGQVDIDRGNGVVRYRSLEVTDSRLPSGSEEAGQKLADAVKEGMQSWTLTSSLDQLRTSLAASGKEQEAAAQLKNEAPEIIYQEQPALLVSIDGKEQLQPVENSGYQSVLNTPYPLFYSATDKGWHLNVAQDVWYAAPKVDGPWKLDDNPPKELVDLVAAQQAGKQDQDGSREKIDAENGPEIVVTHKPAELVVSQGQAAFKPLTGDLLVMSNTDSSVFMDVAGQDYYLVISGRWYRAKAMKGPWTFIAADSLPSVFTEIPADSDYADVRSYIAGTDEAREAVKDAQIPQTAAVKRGKVDIEVMYDGKPKFEQVDGTSLQFAVNASETVIKAEKVYYLVKDGVWYLSAEPEGPWQVSDHAPPGIDGTEPSSPVYNTKYVYVYDATPEVVYVGYTPGYLCSYVYGPTVVFGTGWYYRPWISPAYYYPRHSTWGFSVSYNSRTGWGFGLSWNSGPFHFGWYSGGGWHRHSWYRHGWWGPGGYRPGVHSVRMGRVNIDNTVNINRTSYNSNLYRRDNQVASIRSTTNVRQADHADLKASANLQRSSQANNVYTDRSGNIYRDQQGQWQQRTGGQWSEVQNPQVDRPATGSSIPASRPSQDKVATTVSNRTVAERPVANSTRSSASRSSSGYSRPAGVERHSHARSRSGGGRRR